MSAFTLRWGIIATGFISSAFTKDLVLDSKARNAGDVKHVVTAVGSRSKESAEKFIKSNIPEDAQSLAKGATYAEVYANPEVDVVYIGTPHTMHYENTKDALNAGKHVLCEKPFTFDLEELDELIAIAKKKKLFLMEAVWTRFQPIAYELQDLVFSGKYGRVNRMFADLSIDFNPDQMPDEHRLINAELAGGGLLDLGPYPMVWSMLMMHQNPANKSRSGPSQVTGQMTLYKRTGVDLVSSWIMAWDDVGTSICTTSIVTQSTAKSSITIQLEKADICIDFPAYRPEGYTIMPKPSNEGDETDGKDDKPIIKSCPVPEVAGRGMNYQADEVARCIRDGKTESARCGLEESRIVQGVFDKVRKQGGYLGGKDAKE